MKNGTILIGLLLCISSLFCDQNQAQPGWPKKMVVVVPVADVRHSPEAAKEMTYDKMDWGQTTQILFYGSLEAYGQVDGWLRIKTRGQRILTKEGWDECPGWIQAHQAVAVDEYPNYNLVVTVPWAFVYTRLGKENNQTCIPISIGTKLVGERADEEFWNVTLPGNKSGQVKTSAVKEIDELKKSEKNITRENILKTADLFLGAPYFWGGRSFYKATFKQQMTSSDCSGFAHLCYCANGVDIPRNSKSQYLASKKVTTPQKGDLVFLASNVPDTIKHVMIYEGDDMLIEARGTGDDPNNPIRRVVKAVGALRLGKPVEELKSGEKTSAGVVYFGTFLG